jgi:4-amino-4-deoxy-L-arabinose transferase-like glycosyltransferase
MFPLISNEVFVGFTLPLAVFSIMLWGLNDEIRWWQATLIGLTCALAVMSKYSGIVAVMLLGGVMGLRFVFGPARRAGLSMLISIAIIVATTGWFFWRNHSEFGTPIPGNWTEASSFHYEQHPGFRNVSFYLRGLDTFTLNPPNSTYSSFWGGMYASLWINAHRYGIFAPANPSQQVHEMFILGGGVLLTIAGIGGFVIALGRLMREGWRQPLGVVVAFVMITMWALVYYTMRLPFYSTIKAWFGLCLLPAAAVLCGIGLRTMARNLGWGRVVLYAYLVAFFGLVGKYFWYVQ